MGPLTILGPLDLACPVIAAMVKFRILGPPSLWGPGGDFKQPPPPLRNATVRKIPIPKTVTQVRSFLGLVSYYRRFIKGFSKIAAPLNRLLEKNHPIKWDDECTRAYQELKALLLQEPVVAYPDFTVPFRLYTDASNIG